ncbi:hypothetical protein BN77_p2150107 [Rhizobium mesoamericanum STM3625]|uniref:Uncharacterized protein n=1 Tax=Rhizobium mesoamericanum STM3625 TaxID=1211777 RepID=K0Q5H8_9HYPH|nr:hypothetical protein BN77_p2150107 [Rhizobium mesoamericanum STM3625]
MSKSWQKQRPYPRTPLVRFERGDELKARTVSAIRTVLEAGIVFINGEYTGSGGPGIRLNDREISGEREGADS